MSESNTNALSAVASATPTMEPQTKATACPKCGAESMSSAAFCVQCGSKMPLPSDTPHVEKSTATLPAPGMEKRFCSACGAQSPNSAAFCSTCGTSVSGTRPAQALYYAPGVPGSARAATAKSPYYAKKFAALDANGGRIKMDFNVYAFLFGIFWYLYKGMWAKALIYCGFWSVVILLSGERFMGIVPSVCFGYCGTYDYYMCRRRGTQLAGWRWFGR